MFEYVSNRPRSRLEPPHSPACARGTECIAPYLDYVSSRRGDVRSHAVALAHHFREAEGLSIRQIADRLGRSPATVKAYFYDPSEDSKRLRGRA